MPTWRLALAAAVLAPLAGVLAPVAQAAGLPWWVSTAVVTAGLVAAAGVDLRRAPRPGQLRVERDVPAVLTLDSESEVVWKVTNPQPRPARVRLADALWPSLRAETRRAVLYLRPRGAATARTAIRPERRGYFPLGEVTLRVESPLGLAGWQQPREVRGELRVYPPLRSRDVAEQRLRQAQLRTGLLIAAGSGGGTEFEALREYTRDDEFRHIDWGATARAGTPIVRTYRPERNQTVLVLVDTGRTMAGQIAVPGGRARSVRGEDWTVPRLDHAMDAALALTRVATGLGDAVGLVAFDAAVRAVVPPRGRADQLQRVGHALHELEPALTESDYRLAFVEGLRRFPRRALLVVLTELAEEPMAATLLPALPLVLRDHLVTVVGVRDPEVDAWARAVPADADEAYRKAAAVGALAERRRAAARARGLGARVVDAPPTDLAAGVIDSYLAAKRAGRL